MKDDYKESWTTDPYPFEEKAKSGNGILLIPLLAVLLIVTVAGAYFLLKPGTKEFEKITQLMPEKTEAVIEKILSKPDQKHHKPTQQEVQKAVQHVLQNKEKASSIDQESQHLYRIKLRSGGKIIT